MEHLLSIMYFIVTNTQSHCSPYANRIVLQLNQPRKLKYHKRVKQLSNYVKQNCSWFIYLYKDIRNEMNVLKNKITCRYGKRKQFNRKAKQFNLAFTTATILRSNSNRSATEFETLCIAYLNPICYYGTIQYCQKV